MFKKRTQKPFAIIQTLNNMFQLTFEQQLSQMSTISLQSIS